MEARTIIAIEVTLVSVPVKRTTPREPATPSDVVPSMDTYSCFSELKRDFGAAR